MAPVTVLIPAAGQSSRMRGRDKLLEAVRGNPLIRDRALAALASGTDVIVVLGPDDAARRAALDELPVRLVTVSGPQGLGHSIAAGVRAARPTDALMILPADMPDIAAKDIAALCHRFETLNGTRIVRGSTASAQPGHPVVFPARYHAELAVLAGDVGARAVLKGQKAVLVALAGDRALCDLDTPEDWAVWRARNA